MSYQLPGADQPLIIFSYAAFDDEFEGGALERLRAALGRTIQFISGRAIAVIQPADIAPGAQIDLSLARSLSAAAILVPVLTPGFFRDPDCRAILAAFLERERALGRDDLVLALHYLPIPALSAANGDDPLAAEVARRRLVDWQQLRGREPGDPTIRRELERVAGRIIALLAALGAAPPAAPAPAALPFVPTPTPEPLQLILQFTPTPAGATIAWQGPDGSAAISRFTHPFPGPQLAAVIGALDAEQLGGAAQAARLAPADQATLADLGLWGADGPAPGVHRIVGRRLYDALTADRSGELALHRAREAARAAGLPLSYALRFPPAAVELAALPWETLWDQRQALLLSRGARQVDSLDRYIDLAEAIAPPLPAGRRLHILALAPQAGVRPAVRAEERAGRLAAWAGLRERGLLDWDELEPVTPAGLSRRMRQGPRPDIIHYCGHGRFHHGQGFLILDGPAGGREEVSAARLAAALGETRLIVIQACQSSMLGADDPGGLLTGVAPALSAVAESVLAMQLSIRVPAAHHFAEVFYAELAGGRSLQAAVAEARRSLFVVENDGVSWYVPTLYIRTRDRAPVYLVRP